MHLFVIGLKDTCEVSSDQVANQTLTDARLCTTCTLSARELVRREIRFSCTRSFPFAATTPFRFHLYPPQTSSHGLYQTLRSSCSESKLVSAGKKFDTFQIGSFCDSVATSPFSRCALHRLFRTHNSRRQIDGIERRPAEEQVEQRKSDVRDRRNQGRKGKEEG